MHGRLTPASMVTRSIYRTSHHTVIYQNMQIGFILSVKRATTSNCCVCVFFSLILFYFVARSSIADSHVLFVSHINWCERGVMYRKPQCDHLISSSSSPSPATLSSRTFILSCCLIGFLTVQKITQWNLFRTLFFLLSILVQ